MKAQEQEPLVTQVIYLTIPPDYDLEDDTSSHGQKWSFALDSIASSPGFERLYWGRRLEEPEHVQVHVVKKSLQAHRDFLKSSDYRSHVLAIFNELIETSTPTTVPKLYYRHAYLTEQTQECQALGRSPGMPVGTAIYLGTEVSWNQGAWPLWTHIVRHVDGCRGVSGGKIIESVNGHDNCYLVYVAWETVKAHDDYHHTKHFKDRRIILQLGHKGYAEYGHVVFKGRRERTDSRL